LGALNTESRESNGKSIDCEWKSRFEGIGFCVV
jgi:hypothetical protein